jgi:hypothetical protein
MAKTEIRGAQIKDTDITVSDIADGAVTLAKMANLAVATVIGRPAAVATGVPVALSAAQLSAILGGTLTGGGIVGTGGFTLTVPATGTAALLSAANTFTAAQTITGSADVQQFKVTGYTSQLYPVASIVDNTAATNVVRNLLNLETQSTGTAAAGLGAALLYYIETATAGTCAAAARVYASWVDAANATRKAKLSLSAYDTAERVGLEISADGAEPVVTVLGDLLFANSGAGLAFGSCYASGAGSTWTQTLMAQATAYAISSASFSAGQLNTVTHSNGRLTIPKAGIYLVTWYASPSETVNVNNVVTMGLLLNGTVKSEGQAAINPQVAGDLASCSGSAILAITANQYLDLYIMTSSTASPTCSVRNMGMTVVQIGA